MRMANSLDCGIQISRGKRSAGCPSYCSLGMRWKESRTDCCLAFLFKYLVIIAVIIHRCFVSFKKEGKEIVTYELGKVGLNPRDAYDAATAYNRLDCVSYNGSRSYRRCSKHCIVRVTNEHPQD